LVNLGKMQKAADLNLPLLMMTLLRPR